MKLQINFNNRFYQITNSSDFPYELKDRIKKAIDPVINNYFNEKNNQL